MKLNINDFNIQDLLDFLEIEDETPTFNIINTKIKKFKEKVKDDSNLTNFLDNAKTKIKSHYLNVSNKITSLISNGNNEIFYEKNNDDEEENNYDESDNNNESDNSNDFDNNNKIKDETFKTTTNIGNIHLTDTTFSRKTTNEIFINMNTNNRILSRPMNVSDQILSDDTGNSYFVLPTTYKYITEIKLVDVVIDYNCLNIVGPQRNNNTMIITFYDSSSSYNNNNHFFTPIRVELCPNENTQDSLKKNINDVFQWNDDITKHLNPDLSSGNTTFQNFRSSLRGISGDICYNYFYFDFSGFYADTHIQNIDDFIITIEFPKNNRNYSLANVLGFSQAIFNNKLLINKYTKAPASSLISIFDSSNNEYKLQAASPIDINLNHIYFCLDEFVQNENNNNVLLLADNQFSTFKVLAKLVLDGTVIRDDKVVGNFIIPNANIIKDFNNTRKYDGPVNIQRFRINIVDDFGNNIFLNYKNFHFSLKFTQPLNYIKDFINVVRQ